MANQRYETNINRRYSTININERLTRNLNKYNGLLTLYKENVENAKNNEEFNVNIVNIEREIDKLENILNNINIEIKEKNSYLEQTNNLLNRHKNKNKELKAELKQLENTNAGAIGMYSDITEIYKYVVIEYILIILGIIAVIYYSKK